VSVSLSLPEVVVVEEVVESSVVDDPSDSSEFDDSLFEVEVLVSDSLASFEDDASSPSSSLSLPDSVVESFAAVDESGFESSDSPLGFDEHADGSAAQNAR
jgi:hypothetical protein